MCVSISCDAFQADLRRKSVSVTGIRFEVKGSVGKGRAGNELRRDDRELTVL